jgi:ubiquinol-cytochrome c reductase cytochrome b subunit
VKRLFDWLDVRTGFRDWTHDALYENIPSGARFRYVTGSMLVFAFMVQVITGLFLWMAYSPSSQTAYESVWWIQYRMTGGWLLRGIHHFMAQAMVIVLGLHLLQVVVDGAYRKPREINYWLGLVLMQIVMGLGLTGYLLPWDQKGYWATSVATNLTTLVPVVGNYIQQVAIGGSEYGHHTLTRFFALHAGILPALLVAFLGLHIAVFRKHGITAHITPGRPDEMFWPRQVLFDALACLVLLVLVLGFVVHWDLGGLFSDKGLPVEHRGAELGAPSDPSEQFSAARPEWYFLFLFQLLKYFPGSSEIVGAIIIPGILMTILALMPFIGRSRTGHRFNVAFLLLVIVGAIGLTFVALGTDQFVVVAEKLSLDKNKYHKQIKDSEEFREAVEKAEHDAARMFDLVNMQIEDEDHKLSEPLNIPREGAVHLLRNDPLTQGPKLFGRHCASCHDYRATDPADHIEGMPEFRTMQPGKAAKDNRIIKNIEGVVQYDAYQGGAPNLFGFGTRKWIERLLDHGNWTHVEYGQPEPSKDPKIAADTEHVDNYKRQVFAEYFGATKHKSGDMATFLADNGKELLTPENRRQIAAALAFQGQRRPQRGEGKIDDKDVRAGIELIAKNCTDCHRFGDDGSLGSAPDLTGYGSYEWMLGMISDPTHQRFYRDTNDRMPSFAKNLDHPEHNNVSVRELSLIVDWLRGDYYLDEDGHRVLPHNEETARRTVENARRLELPKATVVQPQSGLR